MSLEELKTLLESTGYRTAYRKWPEGKAPAMPYLIFYERSDNNFAADGVVYHKATGIVIELYTEKKQPEAEALVESSLSEHFWTKEETYIESEHCCEIIYEIEV